MIFTPTKLKGSYVIDINPLTDERGWFARYYCKNDFKEIGHTQEWVQLNHSSTNKKGTVRGMHFQLLPFREIKMVKCIRGSIYDVIVDIRKESSTFLQWVSVELSSENKKMLYIPEGFAHGFQCLEDHCELIYHHSEFHTPNAESGIRYDDPKINITWPLSVSMISSRDKNHLYLEDNFKGI